MRLTIPIFLAALPCTVLGALNGHCTGGKATGLWGTHGICMSISNCKDRNGVTKNGACPFDNDSIKCCLIGLEASADVNPCEGTSYCSWRSNMCPKWVSNKCPGGDDYGCCRLM